MSEKEIFKAQCPRCNGERACDVHGHFLKPWEWTDGRHYASGEEDHRLLQCRGCETVFYHCISWDSNEWDYRFNPEINDAEMYHPHKVKIFPNLTETSPTPDWLYNEKIEPQLRNILAEMYQSRESRSFILASIGLRTAFDRASELLGVDPSESFESKVKLLMKSGYIGESEAKVLSVVADAGSAAAHRGWSPCEEEFEQLLAVLEHFLERNLVTGLGVLKLVSSIPARPPRKPKTR